ncbi:MAG TPA: hypothetical protein VMY39_10800 [Planctomycetota bacterium]|nr:hypothetical protein [Planctomycetota bacterium]
MKKTLVAFTVTLLLSGFASAQLQVEDTGGEPAKRVITVTSPGVFKAEVWQGSGGGLMRFYNLAVDPEAKPFDAAQGREPVERVNLADQSRGLFEIGWHGAGFKGPDKEDCCSKHILNKQRFIKDEKTGEMVRDGCYDGCGDWPSTGHAELARAKKDPKVMGTLEVVESSPARVRVRIADVPFVWWSKYVHDLKATGTYTFYPTGRIVVAVRVVNTGDRPFHWSSEFGPHLMVPGDDKRPEGDRGFTWSTPTQDVFKGGPSEEFILAASDKVKTSLLLTIPVEGNKVFSRWMRHNGRSIGWDRAGYGSGGLVMQPGYDETWTCLIQMGTPGAALVPDLKTATDALPFALDYREPAKITGATLVTDDAGDFNTDGFNESEGCFVLKGPGPLAFTYERGKGAGFAPAFKILGWNGDPPKSVKVDGKDVPCAAGVVDGKLVLQVLGTVTAEKAKIDIAR